MREIKFRVWDKREKRMLRVRAMTFNNNETIHPTEVYAVMTLDQDGHIKDNTYPDDIILMQYTGLNDKNGKEIYEGDIVKSQRFKTSRYIRWARASFFIVKGRTTCHTKNILNPARVYKEKIEAIGNIYENPDLCKEKK